LMRPALPARRSDGAFFDRRGDVTGFSTKH